MSTANRQPSEARPARPGDVGRRAARRREELGLTREEAAARGGLAPGSHPWAGGDRDMWVRIPVTRISGRAVRTGR
ncbi:hypothetical protein AB0G83_17200 [Streptomyces klenkii]|uniref:hypothetical protein n=1 Tax=Streptomyces klenkii TaxID=1420899 RepID=UPI0033CBC910